MARMFRARKEKAYHFCHSCPSSAEHCPCRRGGKHTELGWDGKIVINLTHSASHGWECAVSLTVPHTHTHKFSVSWRIFSISCLMDIKNNTNNTHYNILCLSTFSHPGEEGGSGWWLLSPAPARVVGFITPPSVRRISIPSPPSPSPRSREWYHITQWPQPLVWYTTDGKPFGWACP